MRPRTILAVLSLLSITSASCAPTVTRIPLLRTVGVPVTSTPPPAIPLEVVTRSTAIADPLPVEGSHTTYGEVEAAMGFAVSTAAASWATTTKSREDARANGGWQLLVEITQADADYHSPRLVVSMTVRATLRTRIGNRYLGQTQAHCLESGSLPAEEGGTVVYACMSRIGRDLTGWLGGVDT